MYDISHFIVCKFMLFKLYYTDFFLYEFYKGIHLYSLLVEIINTKEQSKQDHSTNKNTQHQPDVLIGGPVQTFMTHTQMVLDVTTTLISRLQFGVKLAENVLKRFAAYIC